MRQKLDRAKQSTDTIVSSIKEVALAAWEVFDAYVVTHFKSKENFKQLVLKIKTKVQALFVSKKEEKQATAKPNSKVDQILSRFGTDSKQLTQNLKRSTFNLMLFSSFKSGRVNFD